MQKSPKVLIAYKYLNIYIFNIFSIIFNILIKNGNK